MEKIKIQDKNAIKLFSQVENPYVAIAEAIKNSWDADATEVRIEINSKDENIIIKDNAPEGIKQPLSVANSSKKILGKTTLNRNVVGNKGIGIWSLYSLGERLIITSRYQDKIEKIMYKEEEWSVVREKTDVLNKDLGNWRTQIKVEKLKELTIDFLKQDDFQNFLNMFIFSFENTIFNFNIELYFDGIKKQLLCEEIKNNKEICLSKSLEKNSIFSVNFKYTKGSFDINIETKENKDFIGSETSLNLDLNNLKLKELNLKIKKFIEENYNSKTSPKLVRKQLLKDSSSDIGVPDFFGKLFVVRGKKGKEIKKYLNGTYVYIENFNLYNFSHNKDWIGWTEATQNWKANDLKLQNVYSYIKFEDFDEKKLKISQQRSGFVTDMYYNNFMIIFSEILKTILVSANHGSNKKRHIENIRHNTNTELDKAKIELPISVNNDYNSEPAPIIAKIENISISEKNVKDTILPVDTKLVELQTSTENYGKIKLDYEKCEDMPREKRTNISKTDLKELSKGIVLNKKNKRKVVLDWIFTEIEFLSKKIKKAERNELTICFSLLARTFLENIIIYIAIEENKEDKVIKQNNYLSLSNITEETLLRNILGQKFKPFLEIIYRRKRTDDGKLIIKESIENINSYPHNPRNNKVSYDMAETLILELRDFLKNYYNFE